MNEKNLTMDGGVRPMVGIDYRLFVSPHSLHGTLVVSVKSPANPLYKTLCGPALARILLASGIAWCLNTQTCLAGQSRPPICIKLLTAVADEARYCGFFCDQGRIELLQRDYEATCMGSMLPPAPFDIDSASINAAPPAQEGKSEMRAEVRPALPLYSK